MVIRRRADAPAKLENLDTTDFRLTVRKGGDFTPKRPTTAQACCAAAKPMAYPIVRTSRWRYPLIRSRNSTINFLMNLRHLLPLAFAAVLITPAHAGLFDDEEARKRINELTQQHEALNGRLRTLEAQVNNQKLVDLYTQLEKLTLEVNKLRGQLEVLGHEIEATQKRQKDLYVDLDSRLRRLEEAPPPAPPPVAAPPASPTKTPAAKADPAGENKLYEAAMKHFTSENFAAAAKSFQQFMEQYPGSKLAPNAQYWTGNAYSALKDFKSAIQAQQRLIAAFPNSSKVPDAMLNMASSHVELGENPEARAILEDLIARFPTTPAAEHAKRRLGQLR